MNRVLITSAAALALCLLMVVPDPAAAEDVDYVVDADVKQGDDTRRQGWDFTASVGSSISFNDNRKVVGQPDGASWLMGLNFAGAADMLYGKHEWRNSLTIKESFSRTPLIDEFVKSSDELKLESLYIYRFLPPWLGAFGRFALETALLEGEDMRASETLYKVSRLDGTVDEHKGERLLLTDAFQPLKLKESLGLVYTPISGDKISLEARLGFGARHVLADDQFAITDDDATADVIEVTELESFNQAGAEAVLSAWGKLAGKRVTYKVSAEAMTPFLHGDLPAGDDRGAMDLTNIELLAKLSFKLVEWASLDYEFKALREPQLVDEWQLQNNLLLTFSFSLIDAEQGE
jgi:hypothetical protein